LAVLDERGEPLAQPVHGLAHTEGELGEHVVLPGRGVHEAQRLGAVGGEHPVLVPELQPPRPTPAHPRGQGPAADLRGLVGDLRLRPVRSVSGQLETRPAVHPAGVVGDLDADHAGQRRGQPNRQ
jgi:hypothetical protein